MVEIEKKNAVSYSLDDNNPVIVNTRDTTRISIVFDRHVNITSYDSRVNFYINNNLQDVNEFIKTLKFIAKALEEETND